MGTHNTRGGLELKRLRLAPVCVSGQSSSLTSASNRATSSPSSATGPNGSRAIGVTAAQAHNVPLNAAESLREHGRERPHGEAHVRRSIIAPL